MIERTVNFDDKNSHEDYELIFKSVTVGLPKPQISRVEVPFRNGSLDVTDNFGDVKYSDRTISMEFLIPWWSDKSHFDIHSNFVNDVNGYRKKIILSSDPEWYYYGRPEVGDLSLQDDFWGFSVEITADPFKYKDTEVQKVVSGSHTFNLYNDYMKTIPVIYNSASIVLEFEASSYSWSAGTHKVPEIVLKKGYNEMVITGNATVNISYKQGRL